MGKKTINQALKDLFLGLGGNPSALSDNTSVSDYIEDLEGAIKGETSSIIDDTTASESTVYSSSKVESLIPTDELPSVTSEDIGDVLTVVSDGESGATWGKATPSTGSSIVRFYGWIQAGQFKLKNNAKVSDIITAINSDSFVVLELNNSFDDNIQLGMLFLTSNNSGTIRFSMFRYVNDTTLNMLTAFTSTSGSAVDNTYLSVAIYNVAVAT